ncbi:unnamed protein product, partial [Oikopleura dioica]
KRPQSVAGPFIKN